MPAKNGILRGELKVKNGKLVKCGIEMDGDKIKNIKITGDFFIYPEEKIEEFERKMMGLKKEEISKGIREFFKGVELVGASANDFIQVMMKAMEKEE